MTRKGLSLVVIVGLAALLFGPAGTSVQARVRGSAAAAPASAPSLGAAASFAVLAGTTVTNTGSTVVTGDVGVSPGSAITNFPPGIILSGGKHAADALAASAQSSLTTAYNLAAGQACNTSLTGQDLGGLTLTAGVYCFTSSAQLTGTLTLDFQGDPNAIFVFQIGSTLTTASSSSVVVINSGGGSMCNNVFWQVGSSATLGTTTSFGGNILALTSIALNTGASVSGRALARNGAVTLDGSTVTSCGSGFVCPAIALAPATLPSGTIGVAYSQTITGSGGTAPYTFTSTALPAGLTLTSAGVLAGIPTTAATTGVTITGTDANSCTGTAVYTIVIAAPVCPTITLSPATLPNGTTGVAYSQTITGSGGTSPYAFTVTSGTLPAGLTLTAAGVLAGTPTTTGTSTFTIRGTDANGCFAERSYTIIVACPTITLSPATVPNGTVGVAYSQTITGSGGTGPYTFTLTSGALPTGLTLTAAGVLSGTPTALGSFSFTIRGTDAFGCFADQSYTGPSCPVITLSPATLSVGGVGGAYSVTISASGGTAPYTFSVTAGALPAGVTLTAAGQLAGTPTTAGTATFTIRGTDANGCFAEIPYTFLITLTGVPTLPRVFAALLSIGLVTIGYFRLRRRRA